MAEHPNLREALIDSLMGLTEDVERRRRNGG